MRILTPGVVKTDNNTVPVSLECLLPTACRGAILIETDPSSGYNTEIGRSDMYVASGGRRVIAVGISQAAAQGFAAGDGKLSAYITADYGDPKCPPDGSCIATKSLTITQAG
jgi:hypothetical protein